MIIAVCVKFRGLGGMFRLWEPKNAATFDFSFDHAGNFIETETYS